MFKNCLLLIGFGWTLALPVGAQNGVVPVAAPSSAPSSYVGRPIYSEPSSGLQMPPGCVMQPSWRSRMGTSDYEVWIVSCGQVARTWMLKRSIIEMVNSSQARLRFHILDEQLWPDEVAGETLSVQCVGRTRQDGGFVISGAKWRTHAGKTGEVALMSAKTVVRADMSTQKFVSATLAEVECARYPEREAMMLRLQQAPR